jgi:hypothetical protein
MTKHFCNFSLLTTESRGRVVNIPASCSGGPRFDFRPRRPAILIEVFRGVPQLLRRMQG